MKSIFNTLLFIICTVTIYTLVTPRPVVGPSYSYDILERGTEEYLGLLKYNKELDRYVFVTCNNDVIDLHGGDIIKRAPLTKRCTK